MGIAGIGSTLGSVGTQYDFTKLTNSQLLAAAQKLGSEGKISAQDVAQLSFVAQGVDSTPIDRSQVVSVAQTLADPTQKNWIAYFQESSNWQHSAGGTVGVATTDSILKDLQTYQAHSIEETSKTFSAQV
jgi:hypothetical protein